MGSGGHYLDNDTSTDRHEGKHGHKIDSDTNAETYGSSFKMRRMSGIAKQAMERVFPTYHP
jgi:hypothetical protein